MESAGQDERRFASIWSGTALFAVVASPLAPFLSALVPRCLFHSLTGWPCPLCGTTRAALALARFEPLEGLVRFPLPTLFWLAFLGGGLAAGLSLLMNRPLRAPRHLPRWAGISLAGAVFANWIYSLATGV